jgi:chemotaxis signal transduction protein
MHQPSVLIADQPTGLSQCSTAEKHCIFRSAARQFSLPAAAVRELTIARGIVPVPASHSSLAGLYCARGRFLPVISLQELLQLDQSDPLQPHQQLIVIDGVSPWALLISEAVAVDALHSGVTFADPLSDSLFAVTTGTARYGDKRVHLLDPVRLLRFAEQVIDGGWRLPRQLRRTHQPYGDVQ